MKKAMIFCGGWEGHQPRQIGARFAAILEKNGFDAEIYYTLDCLADREKLLGYDLFVPCWTMGEMSDAYCQNISYAVAHGAGIAGCHGGMCDAFRNCTDWQFMTGGQWVAHPGGDGVSYKVKICSGQSAITDGIDDFDVRSEQYYLHVDPAVKVLATTEFTLGDNATVVMPVVWTKKWGSGKVFYCSLGHHDDEFDKYPEMQLIMERGMLWAARGE